MHQEKTDRPTQPNVAPALPRMGLLDKARMVGVGAEVDEAVEMLGQFCVTRVLADTLTGVPSFGKKSGPAKDSALDKAAYDSAISSGDLFRLILLDMMVNMSSIVVAHKAAEPGGKEKLTSEGFLPEFVDAALLVEKACRADGLKSGIRLKAGDHLRTPVEVISARVRRACWAAKDHIGFSGVAEA